MLIDALAARVRRLSELLVEALYVPADRRVLRRVAELAADWREAELALTQDDITGLAGTSRATVNRVLRDARHAGRWSSAGGASVRDADALRRRVR